MKKIWIVILFTMHNFTSVAQFNLVQNGSFEDTTFCPFYYNQIDRAIGWSAYRQSPDYFNSCNNTFVGVPANDEGFQNARTGNAYAGLISYAKFTVDYRECIGTELIQQMIPGKNYFIRFYVSLAIGNTQNTKIATNKLGVKFSTIPFVSLTAPIPIVNYSQIFTDSIISDSTDWVEISGFYVADSAYQFMSIGNFFNDSLTSRISFDTSGAFAYYYIDDVFVIDSTVTGIPGEHLYTSPRIYHDFKRDEIVIYGNDIKSITIIDVSGRKCIESKFFDNFQRINIASLNKGLYIIRIDTSKYTLNQKIINQ